ncbi:hypothetical protein NC651_031356 [Populus alba x Populus x berolinensis]|nr:hypothetical protein NC651_031356 [Populus alba x Populus x berolinensis]
MVAKITAYEESRRKRMEENKKRMEALNLHKLTQALKISNPTKSSPMKRSKPRVVEKQVVVVRRSNRVANKPAPFFNEAIIDRVVIPRRIPKAIDLSDRVFATDEARAKAMEKAEKLQSDLGSDYPIFIKSMLQSNVNDGFTLGGLPVDFCRKNLPRRGDVITLIDEDADEYQVTYVARENRRKNRLSGGWKGFAVAHGLLDGDAVVFQLIKPTTCKLYYVLVLHKSNLDNLISSVYSRDRNGDEILTTKRVKQLVVDCPSRLQEFGPCPLEREGLSFCSLELLADLSNN